MYEHILLDKTPPIGRITFNRPTKHNSMTPAMGEELVRAVAELKAQPDLRVVILTGAGSSFSSGGDLGMITELAELPPAESSAFMLRYYRNYFAVAELEVPTIAMINGAAIGAGLCIALACDLRTMAAETKVGLTFVRVGLNVGMGGTFTLPQLVGWGRAAELLLTGKLMTANEAYEMGLCNRVCARAELEAETMALAHTLAELAPTALRYTKRSLLAARGGSLQEVFELEADGQSTCYKTEDLREGVAAVQQKRKPQFHGR